MKIAYKLISLILAFLLLIPTFTACDSASSNEESTTAPAESISENISVESDSETDEAVLAPRPENNYDTDFFLLIHGDSNKFEYHWVEESANDVLSQAIFDRQQKVYNHLGVSIVGTQALSTSNYIEPFKTTVKNKDGSIDTLLTHVYHGIDGFVTENYLTDFESIPEINLDADYWNKGIMDECAFNDKYYLAKSDFNILYTYAVVFNKDILDKYDDALNESLYDLVTSYRWTLDRMIDISKLVYIDNAGDGKTIDDTFGIMGEQNVPFIGFLNACNVNLIEMNEKGEYAVSAYNDVNKAKTTAIVEKLKELAGSDYAWFWPWASTEKISFQDGTSLLTLLSTNSLPDLLNYDINFGVLPYPMFDESQKDIGYRSLQWGGYTCVPSYVRDLTMVGDTLEMLSFYSEDVNTAFYEKLLGKQVAESPLDKQMLEIIWDSICTDFAQTYFSAFSGSQILYMVPELTKADTTKALSSYMASTEKSVNKILKKLAVASGN
ncbi:MAG: hypothetical protein IJY39_02870 [Clostridia bacterium]|nr:hypothetical protein [Clostridia bacterium]